MGFPASERTQQYLAKNPDGYCGMGGCVRGEEIGFAGTRLTQVFTHPFSLVGAKIVGPWLKPMDQSAIGRSAAGLSDGVSRLSSTQSRALQSSGQWLSITALGPESTQAVEKPLPTRLNTIIAHDCTSLLWKMSSITSLPTAAASLRAPYGGADMSCAAPSGNTTRRNAATMVSYSRSIHGVRP